jgi:hypothetical protein
VHDLESSFKNGSAIEDGFESEFVNMSAIRSPHLEIILQLRYV